MQPSSVSLRRAELTAFWELLKDPDQARAEGRCWRFPGSLNNSGYGATKRNGESLAHRAAYVETFGPIPGGFFVCHRCDVRNCCRPSHLFLGTNADNVADMIQKDRVWARDGRLDGRIRITDQTVIEIRRLVASGQSQTAVAREFGISLSSVSRIARRLGRVKPTGVTPRRTQERAA